MDLFVIDIPKEDDADMERHEFWRKLESFLRNYERAYAPVRWFRDWGGLTKERQGYFVFLRFAFLVGLYGAAFIAIYLIGDMFMLPTSYAFGAIPPMRPLRALVFVFFNYISISIAFALLHITLCRSSFNIDPDLIGLAYFSFTTMTALGLGDIAPARHTILVRFLVVSEVLIGLYFWAVLVGMIISRTLREVKNETSLPE